MRWHLILISFFSSFLSYSLFAQAEADYSEIFGDDYDFALETIRNNSWWSDSLDHNGIDADFALAVVFPELIRYSSVSDYLEVKALEVLYVNYGRDYADFSIGMFQIKPSFAEKIEEDLMKFGLINLYPSLSSLHPDTSQNLSVRKDRILRLKEQTGQLLYLEAFFRIMDHIYQMHSFHNAEEKLVFYSTAYNTGYWKEENHILAESRNTYFYTGMTKPEIMFSYPLISVDYYKKNHH